MSKGAVSDFLGAANKSIRKKVRKSLQTLQISADEREVAGQNMVHPDDEIILSKKRQPNTVEKLMAAEKENAFNLRRSKRTVVVSDTKNYAESPDDPQTSKLLTVKSKSKKTAAKPRKGKAAPVKKNEQGINLNQTKLNFSSLNKSPDVSDSVFLEKNAVEKVDSPSLEVTEDSGIDPSNGVSVESPVNSTVLNPHSVGHSTVSNPHTVGHSTVSPEEEATILTSTSPPLKYWKELAEQRRIALEKTLYENELIYDQLSVLEAENSQLKQLLKDAEKLAQVVKSIME